MAIIRVKQKYCKIEDENDIDFLHNLSKHLSFKYIGVEFTPAYKHHHWDGVERLLSKKLEFMTGLLDYTLDFYRSNERHIDIIDERPAFELGKEIDISKNIEKLGIVPYDYQKEAVDIAVKNDRVIFKHATGSGKSLTAAMITAKIGLPTIVWVIGVDLLYQFHDLFSKLFDQKIGIIGDGKCDIQNINIVSIWTVGKALGLKKQDMIIEDVQDERYEPTDRENILKLVGSARVHHMDECHISAAKTIRTIYKHSNPDKIFGYSGTPWRQDGADLLIEGVFGKLLHEVKASDLIKRGILAKPYIKFLYVKGSAHYTDVYSKVYSDNIINNNYRNNLIVSEALNLVDKKYQVLILFKNISHGKILKNMFNDKGMFVELLTGKDTSKKREEVKNMMLNRDADILLASQIYDIGISIETLSALVLAGGGKSSVKVFQRIGRVIRGGENNGKPFAAIVDIIDDVKFLKKHSMIRKELYETEPEFVVRMPKSFRDKNGK